MPNLPMNKVVVGLSGGVDSSTAAAILKHQGYEVVGLTLWLMKGKGQCCSEGMVDAAFICEQLGIPHHIVDSRDLFDQYIVNYLVTGYEAGITPLPCSQCNKTVKFGPMLHYAREQLGIDKIATGHYARITYNPENDRYQLRRAVDLNKDQSYFLYDLTQDLLAGSVFPLGEVVKTETRRIAAEYDLKTADKPESQDLCLVEANGSMRTFLDKYLAPKPGDIVDLSGRVLGQHDGIHHYTIGQRKGLGIAAPEPLYVIELDVAMNRVIVGDRASTHQSECTVGRMNWVGIPKPTSPIRATVQVRYRSLAVETTVIPLANAGVKLVFDEPQFGITPGQAAVLYDGDIVLGGGIIERQKVWSTQLNWLLTYVNLDLSSRQNPYTQPQIIAMQIWQPNQPLQNGKYVVQKVLGGGGFGVTYSAKEQRSGKLVAIKTLNHLQQSKPDFPQQQVKFVNEAMRLAKCSHPHIVQVHELIEENGLWGMVMEYIIGEDLGILINRKSRQVEIYRQGKEIEVLDCPATVSGEDILKGFVLNLGMIW